MELCTHASLALCGGRLVLGQFAVRRIARSRIMCEMIWFAHRARSAITIPTSTYLPDDRHAHTFTQTAIGMSHLLKMFVVLAHLLARARARFESEQYSRAFVHTQ